MASIMLDRFFLAKNDIKALCAFASGDADRPALNHVVFDAHEGRVFASDGHTLVRLTPRRSDFLPSSAPFRFGVPRETLESVCHSLSRGRELAVYMSAGKVVIATAHETSRDVSAVAHELPYEADLAFPFYEQVIPERAYDETGSSTAYNAEYLARLLLVQRACGTRGLDAFVPEGALAAAKFEAAHDGTEWLVVIMPFRSDRALALDQESRARARGPTLSSGARERLSLPLFRRLVERMSTLGIAEIAAVEQLLRTLVPSASAPHASDVRSPCNGGLA